MKKSVLEGFIKRYSLGGKVSAVNWIVKGNTIQVTGTDEHREIVCIVGAKGISGIADGKYGIFDTKVALALLGVLDADINPEVKTIDLGEQGEIPIKIHIKDSTSTQIDIALANSEVIPKAPEMQDNSLPEWDIEAKMTKSLVSKFKAAAGAMTFNTFSIVTSGDLAELVIGHGQTNSDKFTIKLETTKTDDIQTVSFSNDAFMQILGVINNIEDVTLKISQHGIAFLESKDGDFISRYFLLAKEEMAND